MNRNECCVMDKKTDMRVRFCIVACLIVFVAATCFGANRVKILKTEYGAWSVCFDNVPDGYSSIDCDSCIKWAKERYGVVKFENVDGVFYGDGVLFESRQEEDLGDANSFKSLFGVEFGGVVPKGIKPSYMSDDGYPVYKFTPKKSFRKFSYYSFTATPSSRRIFEVHANCLGYNLEGRSVDAEQMLVMGLLEEKYGRKDIHYNWDLCRGQGVDAGDHGLLFFGPSRFGSPQRARRFIKVFLGESKLSGCAAVGITAVDFEIRKEAMEELKKKSCHDLDAL